MVITHMKKNFLFLFLILLLTLGCTVNKISNTHGFRLVEKKYDKILINKTNKNDIRNMIGPPSSTSNFDDVWIYIERKKTNQSLVKLGKKKINKNNVMLIKFNNMGLVSEKQILDIMTYLAFSMILILGDTLREFFKREILPFLIEF